MPSVEAAGAIGEPGAGHSFCKDSMSASTQPWQAAAAQGEGGSSRPPLGAWRNQPLHGSVGMKSLLLFTFLFNVRLAF